MQIRVVLCKSQKILFKFRSDKYVKTKESNKQTETLTTRSGSDLLVEALVHEDVDFIFGYPGGAVLPLYDFMMKN